MRRYNTDRRARYNRHVRHMKDTHNTCEVRDGRDRIKHIHIPIRYDGYNKTAYTVFIHHKTRNIRPQRYVRMTNMIRDIFPELDTHKEHVYLPTAPYRKHIPTGYEYRPIKYTDDEEHITKDTRTVKCIIMNDDEEILYIGMMRRTRIVNATRGTINITLHRNKRTMKAYERAVDLDRIIHGMTIREIKTYDVEIYYI